MQIRRKDQHILLTPAEMEQAYRECELKYRIKDAERHADEVCTGRGYQVNILERSDYEAMAKLFLANYDCNIAENDLFRSIAEEYIDRCILERGEIKSEIYDGKRGDDAE